ncbi:MAG: HD domain-containing protein, partial [Chromatiaceae bacterium]
MVIRDPVHGDIELSALEQAVLDLPDVQRLRGIKQLGTASFVYPGALHTRFDHSLGACALAHRMIDGLRLEGRSVPSDLEDLIGVGALLHDVTHIPFGHTLEDERRLFPRHDKGD